MGKTREQRRCLNIVFVDFVKAFDTVNRELLLIALGKTGCPPKLKRIIKVPYTDVHARHFADVETYSVYRVQQWGKVLRGANTIWYLRSSATLVFFQENQAHLLCTDQIPLRW